jgi:ABC-type sugar transport system ATPase subunit
MARLRLQNLTKDFGALRAVNDVSLDVADGEFVVILGPSGAGKTTTLKMIAGAETPTSGLIYIGDRLVNALEPHRRNVSMCFESYALYPHFNVHNNLAFPLRAPGVKLAAKEVDRRVQDVAEMLNIHMLLDRLPQHLSNGQKQRVALGRALVRDPDVLMLDEPISHLDAKLRHRMRTEFKALEAEIHTTTLYVTHDYLEALSLGDRLVVLNEGVIQQTGMPDDVFLNPANTFVAKLLGHPQINLVDCSVARNNGALQLISSDGAIRIDVPPHLRHPVETLGADRLIFGIRPLHLNVPRDATRGHDADSGLAVNQCKGVVYVYERLGTKGVLTATVGQQRMMVLTPIEMAFDFDEAITIGIDIDRIMIFNPQTQKNILAR